MPHGQSNRKKWCQKVFFGGLVPGSGFSSILGGKPDPGTNPQRLIFERYFFREKLCSKNWICIIYRKIHMILLDFYKSKNEKPSKNTKQRKMQAKTGIEKSCGLGSVFHRILVDFGCVLGPNGMKIAEKKESKK